MLIGILGFILGVTIGSLAKALADRSLTDRSFWGRSHCESCQQTLSWYDLFPILSYLMLKGRCRYCHFKLGLEYPIVEILSGIIISLIFLRYLPANFYALGLPTQITSLLNIVFLVFSACILIVVMLTDLKSGLIPDRITYPAVAISFFYLLFDAATKIYLFYYSTIQSSLGKFLLPPYSDYYLSHIQSIIWSFLTNIASGIISGLFFLALILVTKSKGMGGGDMKFGIFLGLVLGFPAIITAISLSFLVGAVFGIVLIILGKRKLGQTIPFGPFLSLGGILALLFGSNLLNWYLNLQFLA